MFEHWFVQFWQVMAIGERRWTCRNGFSWKFCAEPHIWRWVEPWSWAGAEARWQGMFLPSKSPRMDRPAGPAARAGRPSGRARIRVVPSARPSSRAAGTAQPGDLQTGHSLAEKKLEKLGSDGANTETGERWKSHTHLKTSLNTNLYGFFTSHWKSLDIFVVGV